MALAHGDEGYAEQRLCSNLLCNVAADGKCVEGFELKVCRFYGKPLSISEESEDVNDQRQFVALPGAHILGLESLAAVLRANESRVIAVIGPHASGKTSLIASLFDLLQDGELDSTTFAGSSTLHAFELACHDARAKSRRETPYTVRTTRGRVSFYHLDLQDGPFPTRTALLLGDRAGEEYQEALTDGSLFGNYAEIGRADCVTILVDGAKLADPRQRHNARHDVLMTMEALSERGGVLNRARIAIVMTKWDAIAGGEKADDLQKYFYDFIDGLRSRFSTATELKGFAVAASPSSSAVARGYGVSSLVRYWAASPIIYTRPTVDGRSTGRLFDTYVPPSSEVL